MSISAEMARKIVEASKLRARELRSPISIAVVDAGGHLVLFERMMSPYGWATVDICIAKASTAVMFNQSTDAVAQWGSGIPGFASSMATMSGGKFIMAAGGWPIRMDGATIGGIGISGGNAPGRDDEIAHAGLAAIGAQSEAPVPQSPIYLPPVGGQQPLQRQTPGQSSNPNLPLPSSPLPGSRSEPSYRPPSTRHLDPDQDTTFNGKVPFNRKDSNY